MTKHIRLIVYSYLDVGTVLKKISYLNKQERATLLQSTLSRENKRQVFDLGDLLREECLMHSDIFERARAKISVGLSLCEEVELICCRDMIG